MGMDMMNKIVAITGGSAGVGKAAATLFARRGRDVAILARDIERLNEAAADVGQFGGRVLTISTDVADSGAVDRAADQVEREFGPIDVWVNVAMATIFSPVDKLTADEFERATKVTYLGQVFGTMAALKHMKPRNKGAIVSVGSALAYRSVPLQSAYCGAKFGTRGFLDSLRSELIHDESAITISTVDLPAINTPQFDWARNKTGHQARPMGPTYQPEDAATAIYQAAVSPQREVRLGFATFKAIVGNALVPALLDRLMAKQAYKGQLDEGSSISEQNGNLFEPVKRASTARGRFTAQAKPEGSGHGAFGVIGLMILAGGISLVAAAYRRTELSRP